MIGGMESGLSTPIRGVDWTGLLENSISDTTGLIPD
jgi:hypothetical protein